jgi:hypothetical protein
VYVDHFTTAEQAWAMVGSRTDRRAVAVLSVKKVKRMRPVPDKDTRIASLGVMWDREGIDEAAPGNRGHAGILGLDCPARKAYRLQLADSATIRFF